MDRRSMRTADASRAPAVAGRGEARHRIEVAVEFRP
jgi:hypothetical protein